MTALLKQTELDHEAGQALQEKENVIKVDKVWKKRLETNHNTNFKSNRKNIQLILDHDENLKNIGRLNELSGFKEIYKPPIWRKKDDNELRWTDYDDA